MIWRVTETKRHFHYFGHKVRKVSALKLMARDQNKSKLNFLTNWPLLANTEQDERVSGAWWLEYLGGGRQNTVLMANALGIEKVHQYNHKLFSIRNTKSLSPSNCTRIIVNRSLPDTILSSQSHLNITLSESSRVRVTRFSQNTTQISKIVTQQKFNRYTFSNNKNISTLSQIVMKEHEQKRATFLEPQITQASNLSKSRAPNIRHLTQFCPSRRTGHSDTTVFRNIFHSAEINIPKDKLKRESSFVLTLSESRAPNFRLSTNFCPSSRIAHFDTFDTNSCDEIFSREEFYKLQSQLRESKRENINKLVPEGRLSSQGKRTKSPTLSIAIKAKFYYSSHALSIKLILTEIAVLENYTESATTSHTTTEQQAQQLFKGNIMKSEESQTLTNKKLNFSFMRKKNKSKPPTPLSNASMDNTETPNKTPNRRARESPDDTQPKSYKKQKDGTLINMEIEEDDILSEETGAGGTNADEYLELDDYEARLKLIEDEIDTFSTKPGNNAVSLSETDAAPKLIIRPSVLGLISSERSQSSLSECSSQHGETSNSQQKNLTVNQTASSTQSDSESSLQDLTIKLLGNEKKLQEQYAAMSKADRRRCAEALKAEQAAKLNEAEAIFKLKEMERKFKELEKSVQSKKDEELYASLSPNAGINLNVRIQEFINRQPAPKTHYLQGTHSSLDMGWNSPSKTGTKYKTSRLQLENLALNTQPKPPKQIRMENSKADFSQFSDNDDATVVLTGNEELFLDALWEHAAQKTKTLMIVKPKDYPANILKEEEFQLLKKEINSSFDHDGMELETKFEETSFKQGTLAVYCRTFGTAAYLITLVQAMEQLPNLECKPHRLTKNLMPAYMIWVQENDEVFDKMKKHLKAQFGEQVETWKLIKRYDNAMGTRFLFIGHSDLWLEIESKATIDRRNKAGPLELKFRYKAHNLPGSVYHLKDIAEETTRTGKLNNNQSISILKSTLFKTKLLMKSSAQPSTERLSLGTRPWPELKLAETNLVNKWRLNRDSKREEITRIKEKNYIERWIQMLENQHHLVQFSYFKIHEFKYLSQLTETFEVNANEISQTAADDKLRPTHITKHFLNLNKAFNNQKDLPLSQLKNVKVTSSYQSGIIKKNEFHNKKEFFQSTKAQQLTTGPRLQSKPKAPALISFRGTKSQISKRFNPSESLLLINYSIRAKSKKGIFSYSKELFSHPLISLTTRLDYSLKFITIKGIFSNCKKLFFERKLSNHVISYWNKTLRSENILKQCLLYESTQIDPVSFLSAIPKRGWGDSEYG